MNSKLKVSSIMKGLGIPANLLGYRYLQYAIDLVMSDASYINCMVKKLYPEVAEHFGTTAPGVERACRHAIEVGWDRGDETIKQNIFSNSVNPKVGKPNNSEFIATIADYISTANECGDW